MTAADNYRQGAVRPSARVESDQAVHPGTSAAASETAPESMALAAGVRAGSAVVLARRPAPPERGPARTGVRPVLPGSQLAPRDWAILNALQIHAFLTADQLRRLFFADHATPSASARICRRVLARLHDQRLIEHLERRIGGIRAGSSSFVWRLGLVGDRLLRAASGDGVRARRKEPSVYYLDHRLAVAEVDVGLREAARADQLEVVTVATEPGNWRRFLGSQGARLILKPDLYTVTASRDYEDSWFIEVDRGTESIPTLIRKCSQYEAYRRTGLEQQASDGVFPLVVWQLPNAARVAKLQAAIRAARSLDDRLFRLTTPDGLLALIRAGGAA